MTLLYQVFGGTLRSAIPISDLPEATGRPPDWTLDVVDESSAPEGERLGSDVVFGETRVHSFRTSDGLALVFDDTGRFDVSRDGGTIVWHRPPGAPMDAAFADITSRVLALALHVRRVFTLHASAVSIGGAGVAFMAPKHHGKSTLCSSLVLAGARAISDDTVPVQPGIPPRLAPGLPGLRLWTDTASRLFGIPTGDDPSILRKHVVNAFMPGQVESGLVPFRAGYVVTPVVSLNGDESAERERLDSVAATLALVKHAKLGPLLTGSESPIVLNLAAEIARQVPIYALHVLRDLDRLEAVTSRVMAWHQDEGAGTA